jgi:hypothetical protein
MRGVVWRLRWRLAVSRRRLLLWNLLVPIVLLLPVARSPAAAPHRAAVLGVFIVFFGAFGGCIPLVRDRARGWSEKVLLTGYGSRTWIIERTGAEAGIDFVELLPALLLVALGTGAGVGHWWAWLPAVAQSLIVANLLGALIAAVVVSIAEAALVCSAVALFALHFSGLFRSAAPGTWAWSLERAGLFRPLAESLRSGLSVPTTGGYETTSWPLPLLASAAVGLLVLLVAPRLARRTARDD